MGKKKISQFPNKATPVAADKFLIEDASGNYYYTTESQLASVIGGASGDMLKSVYDVDNTGVVDNAEAIKIIGRNSTGATLRKGTIIYINGSTGNRPNFVKAQANSEATSSGTFGVIADDLSNNSNGYALCLGYLDNLDTRTTATYPFTSDTLVDGDTIYLSPTTAGYITNVKPSAPNHLVYLGNVTRTGPSNGTIVYKVQNGYEVEELHNMQDVSYSSPIDADSLLIKDSTNSLWKRLTFANLKTYLTGLYVGLTGNQTVAGQKTFSDNLTYDNGTVSTKLLPVPTVPTYMGMFLNTATPNSTNATIYKDASGNTFVNGTSVYTASNAVNYTRTVSSLFQILTGINLQLVDGTANRVLYLDASKNVKTSTVTDTTLGYLDATSSIQTQLNSKQGTLTLTTTGTSGAATLVGNTLNVPNYTSGGGTTRSINTLSSSTTTLGSTANTDYYYICNGACTLTMPTAVGNTNLYVIKNIIGTDTINTTSSQTIDGSTSISLTTDYLSITLISDGANWIII